MDDEPRGLPRFCPNCAVELAWESFQGFIMEPRQATCAQIECEHCHWEGEVCAEGMWIPTVDGESS